MWRKVLLMGLLLVLLWLLTVAMRPVPLWIRDLRTVLPRHPSRRYNRRSLEQIEQIVIHHSAGPSSQTPRDIADYHIGPNHISNQGIPGIAYHFMIDRKAQVFQVNDLETISWHVSGQNTRSIGVCFIGHHDEWEPTEKQMLQLLQLIRYLNRTLGRQLQIAGHRDYANKTCPGKYIDVDWVRQKI